MSTIKSSNEHLTINADGSSKDIKFQANGVEVGSLSSSGVMTATTFTGAATDSTKLPLAGGTLTGNLNIGSYTANSNADNLVIQEAGDFTGITLAADNDQGSNIYFADPEDDNVGGITYRHSTNDVLFRVNGAEKFRITSDSRGLSQFTARAWARINQTGTQAITMSHNCSSVSDNGTGDSTVNFTNAIGSTQYCVVTGNAAENEWSERPNPTVTATGSVRLQNVNHSSTFRDSSRVHFAVYMT